MAICDYLPLDDMVNIPIYLVWEAGYNSILFADHITFNNRYMKRAHTRQRMINDNGNKKENKFDTSEYSGLLHDATTVTLKFKLK